LFLCGFVSVLTTIAIIVSLFSETIAFFLRPEVSVFNFLTGTVWRPTVTPVKPENFGILPLLNGTLMIAVISGIISIPIGLASAIFLSEYASDRLRRILKPALELLAGIPTVVYGYFAITAITPLIQNGVAWFNTMSGADVEVGFFNALSASIVVGIMIIPMVASVSEDAMRAVPSHLREGAYALGARRFEVATRVVVPAALSGIIAAFILGFSRAVGETMAVSIAAGATPRMTLNPLDSVQTMTAFIVQVSFGDAPVGSVNSQSIFAVGATLFVITFVMNVLSQMVLRRFREAYD
jgi:phosphate transport system permease protein